MAFTSAASLGVVRDDSLGLLEGPSPRGLAEPDEDERGHDEEPVDVVRDDGAVGGGVCPAENGLKDAPAAVIGDVGIAALFDPFLLVLSCPSPDRIGLRSLDGMR